MGECLYLRIAIQNNTMFKKVIYPKLPSKFHFIIRFMGSGLANCLFVYARAIILSEKYNLKVINPSWIQFNIGPYLRNEKDKRHYNGLFKSFGIQTISKNWLLLTKKYFPENTNPSEFKNGIIVVEGLKNYFADLQGYSELVRTHLLEIVNSEAKQSYNKMNGDFIGIHIRLGDYSADSRVSLDWYIEKMKAIREKKGNKVKFLVFSDGNVEELKEILDFPNTEMAFFGSAIADILILSKANLIIASDSTFSAWGAYLGQVPILFNKRHFGPVLDDQKFEYVECNGSLAGVNRFIESWISNYGIS